MTSYWSNYLFHEVKSKYNVMPDYCVPLYESLLCFPLLHSEVTSKVFQLLWIIYCIPPFKPLTPQQMCRQWGLKIHSHRSCMHVYTMSEWVHVYVTVAENNKMVYNPWQLEYISLSLFLCFSLSLSQTHSTHSHRNSSEHHYVGTFWVRN